MRFILYLSVINASFLEEHATAYNNNKNKVVENAINSFYQNSQKVKKYIKQFDGKNS